MTPRDDETRNTPVPDLTPEEAAVQRLLRGAGSPGPRQMFRDRLRREFVEGRVSAPIRGARAWFPRIFAFLRIAVPALAVLVLAAVWLGRAPRWQVPEIPVAALIGVDGRSFGHGEERELARHLRNGSRIRTPDSGAVTLVIPGNLAVAILPGTDMTLPAPPGRWFGRDRRAAIDSGELRITTQPGFRGATLTVTTPELDVEVVGTTVAVIRPEFGTCICVLDGTVTVAPHGGETEPVTAGRRFTFFRDEGRIDRGEMLPEERVKLGEFQSLCSPLHGESHTH